LISLAHALALTTPFVVLNKNSRKEEFEIDQSKFGRSVHLRFYSSLKS
jgi:hypothetical protein